jgi:protocatechuate 3,4-dioxygenase beta subunit
MPTKMERRLFLGELAAAVPLLPLARLRAAPPSAEASLVDAKEPGERLHVSGRIVAADGTPASGIRLSVYHTDAEGYYTRPVSDPRRARIRGALVTGPDGRYALHTIRPGNYPDAQQAAHIHVHLAGGGLAEHWIPSFLFEGDRYQRAEEVAASREAGAYAHVMALRRDAQGVWQGQRHIRLDAALAERNRLADGWYR